MDNSSTNNSNDNGGIMKGINKENPELRRALEIIAKRHFSKENFARNVIKTGGLVDQIIEAVEPFVPDQMVVHSELPADYND
uniref:Uncharacterized protein n=1 Tax=viral metagenome TaxID=1070528 RepID=A0A6M3K6G9_9ZZZZ